MIPKARRARGILNKTMPGRMRTDDDQEDYIYGDLVELIKDSPIFIGGSLHISHEYSSGDLGIVLRTDEWSRMVEIVIGDDKIWIWSTDIRLVNRVNCASDTTPT
jgi:hypothetical protein